MVLRENFKVIKKKNSHGLALYPVLSIFISVLLAGLAYHKEQHMEGLDKPMGRCRKKKESG